MIGRTLRQYVITGHLGHGGMGEVWLAHDTTLDRDVALKVLPAADTDAVLRKERFFREAKAASALNHPNIITIYEINADQGVDFIAMEYVHGLTLAALLRQGPMPIDTVERFAGQMAAAVGRAHRANIVHRDLKPSNIMITNDGLLKVLDFGIAKVTPPVAAATDATVTSSHNPLPALTVEGTTIGTLGYMSPEQSLGDAVDARSDVFSFGVIVYEMLAGRPAFSGKTRSEVLQELHLSQPPPLASLRPETPPRLLATVERCLSRAPAGRYPNLTEVAIALSGGAPHDGQTGPLPAAGTGAPAAPPVAAEAVTEASWLRRPAFIGLAVTVLALVASIGWWRSFGDLTSTPAGSSAPAASPYELTQQAAALLARPDRDGNADRAVALLETVLAADPTSAIAYAHLSTAYLRKHQTNPDTQWIRLARESAERALALNADLAAAHLAVGFVHFQAGERPAALAAFVKAAELDPVNAWPHLGLGLTYDADRNDPEAEAAFGKGIVLGPQEWRIFSEFAQFHFKRARYSDAAVLWERALAITPDNVVVLRNLGAAYFQLHRPDEAASILQRALEVKPTAPIYANLGTIRFFQGRYLDAVAAFEKAVELGATNHLNWGNLGDGLRWAPGRRKDAPAAYRRAIELITEQIAKKPGDADLLTRRAVYTVKMGDPATASTDADAAAALPNLTTPMLYRLAVTRELASDRTRALAALERALKSGYPTKDLASEPEFTALRADVRYQRLLDSVRTTAAP